MRTKLSFIIISVMIASVLFGCGGNSTAGTADTASVATEVTETRQISEEKEAEAQQESKEKVTESSSAETVSVETEEKTGAPSGYKYMGQTIYYSDGSIRTKIVNDMYGDSALYIFAVAPGGPYNVRILAKEMGEDGKWTGSTIYSSAVVSDLSNLDVYKTEKYIVGTESCSYDENGIVVEQFDSNGNKTGVNTYNNQNQLVLQQAYRNDEVRFEAEYTYDEQGIMSKVFQKAPEDEAREVYEYLAVGVVPLMVRKGTEGEEQASIEMELHYDKNGKLTGGTEYHRDGQDSEPSYSIEYTFELDENGNLIRDTWESEDGEMFTREWDVIAISE